MGWPKVRRCCWSSDGSYSGWVEQGSFAHTPSILNAWIGRKRGINSMGNGQLLQLRSAPHPVPKARPYTYSNTLPAVGQVTASGQRRHWWCRTEPVVTGASSGWCSQRKKKIKVANISSKQQHQWYYLFHIITLVLQKQKVCVWLNQLLRFCFVFKSIFT